MTLQTPAIAAPSGIEIQLLKAEQSVSMRRSDENENV